MKIREAIEQVDELCPNTFDDVQKVRWLARLDHKIYHDLFRTHHELHRREFHPYNEDTDLDTELLACEPYTDLYLWHVQAEIHRATGEVARYTNAAQAFNVAYLQYADYINRKYMPVSAQPRWYK